MSILDRVAGPEDLRRMDPGELERLAGEIRELIIKTVSFRGGHLSSSLGAVELTLALHYVFATPKDRLIWDVGHQAYAHKIVTARKERFDTLRQKGGISGFPRREESPYDTFGVGHSSTSISAAAGMAAARGQKGEKHKVVAVIGDGSLSAGMAFEGLNWSGDQKQDLVVVLNDNELSISPNVGALSSYLNRIMTGQRVTRLKSDIKALLNAIPAVGSSLVHFSRQLEEALKSFIVPGVLFEELGFTYVGPLSGHRLDHLIKNFQNVREMKGPVLVHVVTKKGKGYQFAEENPQKFHGASPFDVQTGEFAPGSGRATYTKIFGQTLVKLAGEHPELVAITAAMTDGTGLAAFAQKFPERFYDVGIAEQHALTFAAGLATEGLTPLVAIYSTFMQRAYDQILHDVCLQKLPVVMILDRGGLVGADGPTHHGLFDLSFLRIIPHLVLMAPKDENELRHMLKTALMLGGPVAIRYPRGEALGVKLDEELIPLAIGTAEVLREGREVAIMAIGASVAPAMEAAGLLDKQGISASVVNARFIKPLDEEMVVSMGQRHSFLVTVEENVLAGGFGSAVLEVLDRRGITGLKTKRIGIPDEFVEHASQKELRRQYGLDGEAIARAILDELGRGGSDSDAVV